MQLAGLEPKAHLSEIPTGTQGAAFSEQAAVGQWIAAGRTWPCMVASATSATLRCTYCTKPQPLPGGIFT